MRNKKRRLIIIDSNSIIYRAFHALPPLKTKKGEVVGAVYGFLLVFFKIIKEFKPYFIIACFDSRVPTFRHKKFKQYKANRPPTPKELSNQMPKVKEFLASFKVSIFEKEGFEADDLIGTISKKVSKTRGLPKIETIILSGDLDVLQLIDVRTKVFLLRRGIKNAILYDENQVKERYGIRAKQLLDIKALKGDPSDNIPGVTGIGEKTAIQLIKEFGTVENLYTELEKKSPKTGKIRPSLRKILLESKNQAFLSKDLVTIKHNISIDFSLNNYQWGKYKKRDVLNKLKDFGFKTLIKRLSELEENNTEKTQEGEKLFQNNLKLW